MRPSLTRRRWLAACGGLAVAPGWADGTQAAQPKGEAATLRVVGPWEINGLEPASAGHLFTRMQVTETLTGADAAGRPEPALASHWTSAADGLSWRFELRPGARFHDGTPVAVSHVAAMLERARQRPGVLGLAPIAGIEASGNAVHLRLRSRFASLPALLAHSSVQILAPSSFDAQGKPVRVIGSGPYKVSLLEPPQRFETRWFEGHDSPAPAVRQASYLCASRPETRALMAEAGQADIAFGLDPASLQRLQRGGRVAIEAVTVPRTAILKLNAGHRWLSDPRAREALSLAIDRAGIARALLRDPALAASQLFPPTLADWHVASLPALRTDPAAARERWEALGWRRGPDGIFMRDGERLRLTLRTFPDRPELPMLATAIQEQLRQTGVEVRVLIGNSSDIPARHRDGSLELALAARQYALVPDPLGTLLQDFGPRGGDWGAMNWASPSLQEALQALSLSDDPATRSTLRARVATLLHDGLPVIPVAWYRLNAAVAPRVAGLRLDPLERSYRLTELRWREPAATR